MASPQDIDFSMVLASSVHDMKNSVSMLLASLDAVLGDIAKESQQVQRINTLQYEASRINNELVQLLSIYRLQQDRLPMNVDDHFVRDVLEDQIARNHPLIESKGITLSLECDPDLEAYFDADLVGSVIQNIVVNGCRYTHQQLRLGAYFSDDFLTIWVADDGDGFPEHMVSYPLEPKVSNNSSTQLGLYFASVIASLHKTSSAIGRIHLRNGAPLGGGVFEMIIPN